MKAQLTRRGLLGAIGGAVAVPHVLAAPASGAAGLTIERVESFKVVVPMKKGSVYSENYGPTLDQRLVEFDRYPKFIIKMHGSNGQIGWGETGRQVPEAGMKANIAAITGKRVGTLDLGERNLGLPDGRTADGFEIALYDLLGKTVGLPVHALLGGRKQKKVSVSYWTGQRTLPDLIAVGRRGMELGFKNLKFKARFGDPIEQQLDAVAKANPQMTFIVDFNSSYPNPASFIPIAHRLQGYKLIIEDPVPKRLEYFKRLRDSVTIPFALTPTDQQQIFEAVRQGACDVFNLGGNMRSFVRSGFLAEMAGIPAWHGSGVELGIRDMSFIHAAASTTSCTIPSDTLCFFREHDLLGTRFQPVDGHIAVPDTPGLGIEVDEDAIRHYTVA